MLRSAQRDFIAALPGVVSELADGTDSILPEGFFTHETPTPAIVIADLGDGESAEGSGTQLLRSIVYVMDRGRGYSRIDRVLHRLREGLNNTALVMAFFTFPPGEINLQHLRASGRTATATFPQWNCEGQGLYVFTSVGGLTAHD